MSIPKTFHELARVNTGAHFLDSGGAYGRHWEKPPIPEEQPTYYARRWGSDYSDVDLFVNQAALLSESFDIDERATHHYRLWARIADPHDEHGWLQLAERYCERMVEKGLWEGDNAPGAYIHYTYNDPDYNDLDQDFQVIAPSPYSEWALVQSHNGCDARGGLTAPVVVRTGDMGASPDTHISPYCHECGASAENMYYAGKEGWRIKRLQTEAILVCPKGHRETWPTFPYVDDMGPEPDRDEPHDPEPDEDDERCLWCGELLEWDGDECRCVTPPPPIPKEQMPLFESTPERSYV